MRKITEIILHCTATRSGREVTLSELNDWHHKRNFKRSSNGNYCGYHYLIHLDGVVEGCRPLSDIGQHCSKHNQNSIGICYVGGLSKDGQPCNTLTSYQLDSLYILLNSLMNCYNIPYEKIYLHSELANKSCPCFSREWFNLVFNDRLCLPVFHKTI